MYEDFVFRIKCGFCYVLVWDVLVHICMFVWDVNKTRIYFFVHSVCNCPFVPANNLGKARNGFMCWMIVICINQCSFFNWLSQSGNKECSREHCLSWLTWCDRQTDVQTGGREVIFIIVSQPANPDDTETQPQVVHLAKNIINKVLELINDNIWWADSRKSTLHEGLSSGSTEAFSECMLFSSVLNQMVCLAQRCYTLQYISRHCAHLNFIEDKIQQYGTWPRLHKLLCQT